MSPSTEIRVVSAGIELVEFVGKIALMVSLTTRREWSRSISTEPLVSLKDIMVPFSKSTDSL
jgi:hypothetical protein